jgi:hypothetical protein
VASSFPAFDFAWSGTPHNTGCAELDQNPRFCAIASTDSSSIVTANALGVFREHGNSSTILKKAPWAVACDLLALQPDFGFDEAPTRF